MKKLLLLSFCLLSCPSFANCEGGTVIEGNSSGKFCVSDVYLNWWSAHSWCRANKLTLAKWDEACPHTNVGWTCNNLSGKAATHTLVWLDAPHDKMTVYFVNLSNGNPSRAGKANQSIGSGAPGPALCFISN